MPRLKLAFSCEPDVPTEAVTLLPGGAFSAPVLRLEFAPLTQADCQARLAERFREQALGPEHPDVITVRNNYADLLKGMGRTEEAIALENRAKAIQ